MLELLLGKYSYANVRLFVVWIISEKVELFVKKAGDITPEDIYKLILEDKNFQPDILDSTLGKRIPQSITPEYKKKFIEVLRQNYVLQERALANHDLFKQLSGNPFSVRLLAA